MRRLPFDAAPFGEKDAGDTQLTKTRRYIIQLTGQGRRDRFRLTRAVLVLCFAAGLFSLLAAGIGLVAQEAADPITVTSPRGEEVEVYGRGIYRADSLFIAGNNRSSDLTTLLLGLPLLVISLVWATRGSIRGRLLLVGTLGYHLYVSAGYALGAVAFNDLFLIYVAWLSTSLFAFVLTMSSVSDIALTSRAGHEFPRRWPGGFMIASGILTLAVWIQEPIASLISGTTPDHLDIYSTLFTHAFDLAIIVPAAFISGAMILKRRALGYVVASSLLVLEALLMPLVIVGTFVQIRLGIAFAPGEIVGPIAGFSVLGVLAVFTLVLILRHVPTAELVAPGSRGDENG